MIAARLLQFAYVVTPFVCWCFNAFLGHRRIHWALLFVVSCFIGYVVLLVSVQVLQVAIEAELFRHDLNGDGVFSATETTEELEQAMDAFANDTARTFAPYTGIPITFIWNVIAFVACFTAEAIGRRLWARPVPCPRKSIDVGM